MIFVKIHYGLGNQMFQYAFAKSLSLHLNVPFKLDISFFNTPTTAGEAKREYGLNIFNIEENLSTLDEILRFTRPNFLRRRIRQLEHFILPLEYRSFITEEKRHFEPRLFNLKRTCYINGYWQNELYFNKYVDDIKHDFSFRIDPDIHNQNILTEIRRRINPVSVHVRRGDYLTDKKAAANMELSSLDYYNKAIDFINERIEDPYFYIFSDDSAWARQNFELPNATFIDDYNSQRPYEDLRLMSACRHFIIANSSFSWWGAWLGENKDKIVVGPRKWFKNGDNIMPEGWVKI